MSTHFHFIGIGGVGMGPLASLIRARGNKVTGSDLKESALTIQLKNQGAEIFIGHDASNIQKPDYVVYSSAIAPDNPEMQAARNQEIPLLKRAQVLAELANAQTAITVAGAHGKTTTTSMISYLLIQSGVNPTTAVGGVISGKTYNANLGDGRYFVAEADESDGTFLFFKPHYSIITNIDFEHLDYYQNWENILKAYAQFIDQTNEGGCIIAYGEDARLGDILMKSHKKYLTYGLLERNDMRADNIRLNGFESSFDCIYKGRKLGTIELKVPGQHNILNALAAILLGLTLDLDFDIIRQKLKKYSGVQRRFQLKEDLNEILIIDDYGHHPSEITAALQAAQSFGRKRVITVFQPHRYTRTQRLLEELAESLCASDYLIVTDVYAAGEPEIQGVNSQVLVNKIRELGKENVVYCLKEDILTKLIEIIHPGDFVLTLGAGDVYKSGEELARHLRAQFKGSEETIKEKIL